MPLENIQIKLLGFFIRVIVDYEESDGEKFHRCMVIGDDLGGPGLYAEGGSMQPFLYPSSEAAQTAMDTYVATFPTDFIHDLDLWPNYPETLSVKFEVEPKLAVNTTYEAKVAVPINPLDWED